MFTGTSERIQELKDEKQDLQELYKKDVTMLQKTIEDLQKKNKELQHDLKALRAENQTLSDTVDLYVRRLQKAKRMAGKVMR